MFAVSRERHGDHLNLVSEILREKWPQWAVGEAHREDAFVSCSTFTAGKAAGDSTDGVESLFVVDGQGEEIDPRARIVHTNRDEHHGVAQPNGNGCVCLLGHKAVFYRQCLAI